jgi:hypothetical protein
LTGEEEVVEPPFNENISYGDSRRFLEGYCNHEFCPIILKNDNKSIAFPGFGEGAHNVYANPLIGASYRLGSQWGLSGLSSRFVFGTVGTSLSPFTNMVGHFGPVVPLFKGQGGTISPLMSCCRGLMESLKQHVSHCLRNDILFYRYCVVTILDFSENHTVMYHEFVPAIK